MGKATDKGFTVIISCFNEEKTIEECLDRLCKTAPNAEILVIHGGADQTLEIARRIAKNNGNIKPLKNYGDTGKGHGVKTGISIAKHDLMVQIDADLQFMPEDISRLIEPILKGEAEIAVGSRFMKESNIENYDFSFFRDVGNRIVCKYVSLLANQKITDITTGLKAWTRKAIEDVNFRDNGFVYEMEIALRGSLSGYKVARVPVTYNNRLGGISGHGRGWREPISIIWTGIRILVYATIIKILWTASG